MRDMSPLAGVSLFRDPVELVWNLSNQAQKVLVYVVSFLSFWTGPETRRITSILSERRPHESLNIELAGIANDPTQRTAPIGVVYDFTWLGDRPGVEFLEC